jgi:hypothetical protein
MSKEDDACCDLRELRTAIHLRQDAQDKAIAGLESRLEKRMDMLSEKLDKFFLVVLSTLGLGVVSLAVGIVVKLLKD